jgi:hypothetical protein
MKPGIDSMSIAILRPPSWMMATSSALRAKKLAILNAPGSVVLPLLARTLVPNPKGPTEVPLQGKDLAAVNASEVGSGERD